MSSPLSPQEIRAAAEAHHELGPEYSDAVVASFLERVNREIDARAGLRQAAPPAWRAEPAAPDVAGSRAAVLKGVAIGLGIGAFPMLSLEIAASHTDGGHVKALATLLVVWLVATAACAVAAAYGRRTAGRRRPADW